MEEKIILLVEDNPDDVDLTLRAFRKNNILNKIIVARDGVEALDYLFGKDGGVSPSENELPVVILLDLKLPKVDGLEVLRKIRQDRRTEMLPVVILKSSLEQQDLINGYKLGANSYIRKPVDFHDFIEAVKTLGLYWLVWNKTAPRVR